MNTLPGTVLGPNDAPMVNTPVTLLGATTNKVVLTSATGDFSFPDLDDGEYKLIATHNEFNAVSRRTVTIKEGEEVSAVILRLTAKETKSISEDKEQEFPSEDKRFVILKYCTLLKI